MFVPAQDPLTSIEDGIRALMTSKLDLFVSMGLNLFRGFATILIAWFGIQSALSSAEGGEGFNFTRFTRLLLVIAFCFAMVKYYSSPIPGIGQSFPDLVMQEASSLSNSIGMEQGRLVETKVTEVEQGMEQPSSFSFHETLTFVVLYVILATIQAVVLMIIGFGLIAQAVLLLVGPIFIPFFIVPKMDWLFWGWFKAFLQYSFYQVIASAFVYIFAKLLLAFFAVDTGGMSVDQWMTAFPAMLIFLLIAIYGLLKIPTLTNHLFSGAAGADSGLAAAMIAYVSRG
jgi:TrbL/VirB6 plasmid conjugal transfer protein